MVDHIKRVLDAKSLEDLKNVSERPARQLPKLTKAKVENAIEALKDVESHNGYLSIARQCDLTMSQVKQIHRQMLAKIAELTPVEEEPARSL